MARRTLRGIWLGRRPYAPVYALQNALREARLAERAPDTVLLLEHDPVITLGRGGHDENLLATEAMLSARGVSIVRTDRGGDVTVHAPGQLVAYPIVNLAPDRCDVRRYVRDLAETMRRVVRSFGVDSGTVPDMIGLWVDPSQPATWPADVSGRPVASGCRPEGARPQIAKIGAIGVRISRWVTMHGFALNLAPDLGLFQLIVPCGISEYGVTSVEVLTGEKPDVYTAAHAALQEMGAVLDADVASFEDWSRPSALDDLALLAV